MTPRILRALTTTILALLPSCGDDTPARGVSSTPNDAGVIDAPDGTLALPRTDYLVVAADALEPAALRFKAYRESTGHVVEVTKVGSLLGDAADRGTAVARIRDHIKKHFEVRDAARPFFVLLLGDATAGSALDGSEIPGGQYVETLGDVTVLTDNTYADMDGDHIPDLALGRIPVSTDADAESVLEKTRAYESVYEVGTWNRRLNLFASTAGFGDEADAEIEAMVFKVVEEIPYDFDITLTYAKQTSPYVFVPERFSDKVYDRINEGSLMVTYVGHGYESGFATLRWSGADFPILDTTQLGKVAVTHKSPLLTLIACLTGKFTEDSVSERLLRTAKGPAVVFASTEVSHPYANAIFVRELSQVLTKTRAPTVGELFVQAKRRSIENGDPLRQQIELVAGFLLDEATRESLRRSHLYMYTLFGDPALRIPYVRERVDIASPGAATPGTNLAVTAAIPNVPSGSARVSLEAARSTIPGELVAVPPDGDPTRDSVIEQNYATANRHAVAETTASYEAGSLAATLAVPAGLAAGDYYVTVYAHDGSKDAFGSARVTVTP